MKIPLTLRSTMWFGIICVALIVLAMIISTILELRRRKKGKQLGKDVKKEEDKQKSIWSFWGKI